MSQGSTLIAISVGNSRTQLGRFEQGRLVESVRMENAELADLVQRIVGWWRELKDRGDASILMASVADDVAGRIASAVEDQLGEEVYRIGDDLPVPIGRRLDPETITGVDRLLNAAAAFDVLKQACIVVDAGTAVTVDFVDGEGTFHGGAIAPGGRMQLRSLHDCTSALPEIEFHAPEDEPFGRSTGQAMLQGVYHGIRGLVWRLVEQYASAYGAFPPVVATGGDAEMLFKDDEIVDRIIPDLTLMGIAAAARHALAREDDG
jgi:type III pantothenate kinase